jgi:hypothetical protein
MSLKKILFHQIKECVMFKETLDKENFVIVNIWTSEENEAIPGSNVGHVSLQTKHSYISLWPSKFERKNRKLNEIEKLYLRYFGERPPSFKLNYEEDCAFEALSENQAREIRHVNDCLIGEVPYLVNSSTGTATVIQEQSNDLEEDTYFLALKPLSANVRIVIYGLRIDKIESEFETLKSTVRGWRLIGSNFYSQNFNEKSAENCSSLAYRLLKTGGLYLKLEDRSSSENSSVVSPDDLVKHLIPYKEKELVKFPYSKKWFREPICSDESSIEELKKKFEDKKNENSGSSFIAIFGKTQK